MLAARSTHSAIERLHESDLFGVIHLEPHTLLNQDRVAEAWGAFDERATIYGGLN
jgi:hypothetical protein